jgi:hypothetical protein
VTDRCSLATPGIREGVFMRLADTFPERAARYYGFDRTCQRLGWVPVTSASISGALKETWAKALTKLLDDDDRPSPWWEAP